MNVPNRLRPWSLVLLKRSLCSQCRHHLLSSRTEGLRPTRTTLLPPPANRISRRNAGTKLRKSIEELPQGLQAPLEPFVEKETSKYSPVMDEVLQNQRRFPKCVLLTRVGQFYEVLPRSRSADSSCTSNKPRRLHHC